MDASVARERAESYGLGALSNEELIGLVLTGSSPPDRIVRLLESVGSIHRLASATAHELMTALTNREAQRLRAAVELGRRTLTLRPEELPLMASPRTIATFLLPRYGCGAVESFGALYLNTKHRLIHHEVLTRGTLDTSLVHPRELFKPAIERRAASVVLFHNHPSGDPKPSADDVAMTERCRQAGAIIGIKVLDHIILADTKYFSFQEGGRIS